MFRNTLAVLFSGGVAALTLSACAGVQPVPYQGINVSSEMKRNHESDADKTPYRYAAPVVWSRYSQVKLDPVVVYQGADNQFGEVAEADKVALADYMKTTFLAQLSQRFELTDQTNPNTLRIKLTLTGAETTTPFVGQFAHFDIGGNLYNGVQAIRGGKAAFSGSVSYAVEVYDSASGRLLKAYVSKQYPNAMNLSAAFGALHAARTGLDKGAEDLVTQLH